jgi:hypothetical protein
MNCFNKSVANFPYKNVLALITEDALTWEDYNRPQINRLYSESNAIRAVTEMLSRKALRMLYIPYVHILEYNCLW